MATWRDDIVQAFENLGGAAPLRAIYEEVARLRSNGKFREEYIRRLIQNYSSASAGFKGKEDLFYPVEGLRGGVWGLKKNVQLTATASDIDPPPPEKKSVQVYRTLRDTPLVRRLKRLHKNRCQICGSALKLRGEETYSEGHHLQPLGGSHLGPDIEANIIIVCPNHHALCDFQAIELDGESLRSHPSHHVGQKYLDYHNALYRRS